jgi:DNA-binding LytR/AlgR family response regulator
MLKIAICDDEQPIREYLKKLTEKCTDAEISMFADGGELLAEQTEYDVILLDISLNQEHDTGSLNGMDVARKIRKKSDAVIIFVTALKEYVFEGYDVGAFHYLLKPIDEQKFMEVMDRAISLIQNEKKAEPLIIKMDGNYIKISVNNIIYAENEARKIILHTKNMKEKTYSFYEKMEALEHKLGENFFRSHRGFLVNLQEVAQYDHMNIELKNGEKVFLAKQKYNDFVTAYMNYLRKGQVE